MSENKTHFKKLLDYNYIGSHDLEPGEKRKIVFEKFEKEEVHNPRTNKKEWKAIGYIKGSKPMIINRTNFDHMAIVTGSEYIEDWVGVEFTVHIEQVRMGRELVDALRIDTSVRKPVIQKGKAELEMLTEKSKKWDQVTGWLKGQQDFDKAMTTLSGKYKVSPGIKKKLKELFEGE